MSQAALAVWRERLEFLETEEAIAASPDARFAIKKQIEAARAKIAELVAASRPATKPALVSSPAAPLSGLIPVSLGIVDVLILAANPQDTPAIDLEWEAQRIAEEVVPRAGRPGLRVAAVHAATVEELTRFLREAHPRIVHFAGHGMNGDLLLQDRTGAARRVSPETLMEVLRPISDRLECLVFNACETLPFIDVLRVETQAVIAMSRQISDRGAQAFATGFYRALSFGDGYAQAFEQGLTQIALEHSADQDIPRCFIGRKPATSRTIVRSSVTYAGVTKASEHDTAGSQLNAAEGLLYPIWFGTDRKPIDDQDPSKGFGTERAERLIVGTCEVFVPECHKIGSLGSPWWKRWLTRCDDRLRIASDSLRQLAVDAFWQSVRNALEQWRAERGQDVSDGEAFVFLHGFNVTFEEAALRAAQLGCDLNIPGLTAFYSWPSRGEVTGYAADEATIEVSERFIGEFLEGFLERSGARRVNLLAHSMGNRGLLRAMQRLGDKLRQRSGKAFGQIFLCAPDVDSGLFRDLARLYPTISERTTLYVSPHDQAVRLSMFVHDAPRAGFYEPVTVIPQIDTVAAGAVSVGLLGHGYYGDSRPILQDMFDLLRRNAAPNERQGMTARRSTDHLGHDYWEIRG